MARNVRIGLAGVLLTAWFTAQEAQSHYESLCAAEVK